MSRPSRLYRTLGLPAGTPLLNAQIESTVLGDNVHSIRIQRGGSSIVGHTPATVTIEAPGRVHSSANRRDLRVRLTDAAAAHIAGQTYSTASTIRDRFYGRSGPMTAHDKGNHRGGWNGTTITGAAWSSLYAHAPKKWTPYAGATLSHAAVQLLQLSWEPRAAVFRGGAANAETWPAAASALDAAGLLSLLTDRLYHMGDNRNGTFRILTLDDHESRLAAAAVNAWPLARAHVLAPTDWEQASQYPTEYQLDYRTPTGTAQIITGESPSGTARVEALDWTDLVTNSNQWRRVYGLRWESFTWPWHLPSLTVRLDHLIASPRESARRAAGMLLSLNVGDGVPLAGDWPDAIEGVHIVAGLEEQITPQEWLLKVDLAPHGALAGLPSAPVKPRTWDQAGTRTWDQAGTATWNQGVPA